MLDKSLIKKNFKKSIVSYSKNAVVQESMAQKLVSLIKEKTNRSNFKNILEIGSYTGFLTKQINENFDFENYLALDIVNSSKDYIQKINPEINFLNSDIESFSISKDSEKFDLIATNASLQWCDDFKSVILKLKSFLKEDGVLALSTFEENNLFEIKETFNISLNYLSQDELKACFSNNASFFNESKTLEFKNGIELLKHLKLTGVNSIQKNSFSYLEIKQKLALLEKNYDNKLTYKPFYIIDTL